MPPEAVSRCGAAGGQSALRLALDLLQDLSFNSFCASQVDMTAPVTWSPAPDAAVCRARVDAAASTTPVRGHQAFAVSIETGQHTCCCSGRSKMLCPDYGNHQLWQRAVAPCP